MVTRVSHSQDMGGEVVSQMFGQPKVLYITAAVIGVMGIIPGMPHIVFLGIALVLSAIAYTIQSKAQQAVIEAENAIANPEPTEEELENKELAWEDLNLADVVGLEVGYRLIALVDKNNGGKLLSRVKGVRKKLSQGLGFLVPAVHIRDNLDLSPNTYRITLAGVNSGEAEIFPDKELAINPDEVFGEIQGIETTDPAFGLKAIWIEPGLREQAQGMGYTVVDAETVIATHLSQILQDNSSQLLGFEEVQKLLDRLADSSPKLVAALVPDQLQLGTIVKVLQGLLREGIPLTDIRTIVNTLAEAATHTKNADDLIAQVRIALSRLIVQNINGNNSEFPVITLQPDLEQLLQNTIATMGEGGGGFEPSLADKLQKNLADLAAKHELTGQPAVLVVPPKLRVLLANFAKSVVRDLHVLSYHEIPDNKQIRIVGSVG